MTLEANFEHRLTPVAFGSFPGWNNQEKNFNGIEFDLNDEFDKSVQLSSSDNHIIIVRESGRTEGMGLNSHGQLGIGTLEDTFDFVQVKTCEKMVTSACGTDFTLWLNQKNELFIAGGKDYLKVPTKICSISVKRITVYSKTVLALLDDTHIKFWPDFEHFDESKLFEVPSKVTETSCADRFAIVLCETGSLFKIMFGEDLLPVIIPMADNDAGFNFISASCSANYIATVDSNGGVWIIGQMHNYNGSSAIIPIMEEAKKVFAFPRHCIIFDEYGFCFSLGANDCGQLGSGATVDTVFPLPMNQRDAAFYAAGGDKYTILLPFGFDSYTAEYYEEDIVPGSLVKTLQSTENFVQKY